ncbi:MAG TPA: ComEA family DNA-binding protein [Anaerolineales bacterium]|nr:ComEA family DNA-binding protein [Anaerolineales bacterium]
MQSIHKAVWLILLGVAGGLLGAGLLFLISRPPVGDTIALLPAPTNPPFVVYVSGAVTLPDVYNLPPGSRVADAIRAAGGMTDDADPQALNLAQVVADGMRIHVPDNSADTPAPLVDLPVRGNEPVSILININTANQEQLESLPEIGPHIAGEIITYREANGPFTTVDELLNVPGVGTITLEAIRELITVEDQP